MKQFFSVVQLSNGRFFTLKNEEGTPQIRMSLMLGPTDPDPDKTLREFCKQNRCRVPEWYQIRVVMVKLLSEA